ncbi:unnamed protein product [Rhizoctonia solani]|uniref:Nab2 type CCCH zinc finger 4 domain-containing protein n=1 Tax=Rhizoctonia solani TaxID=456999 RepID=A0A8H3E7K2_9AGAM|nr:unnamed protein product [Rhizoctonia solani]
MGSDLVMGTPKAGALQASIQKELVAKGYSDESDLVMAEYITIMLINSKTAEQITNELVDLVGPEYGAANTILVLSQSNKNFTDTSFTSWLFDEVAKVSASDAGSAEANTSVQAAQSSAPSEPVGAPSPGQKRRADGRSPSPASKSRRTTDLPDRPRAMRDGPSNNEPQPVRSLLDRVEPREPRRHGGFDHVQAQIDSVTRGGHHGGRMMGRGGGMGMNGHHHQQQQQQQQQQQMMMNQMMGGVNPIMFQEIMANQMALMSQMAANMGMIQGGPPVMGPGGPGFGLPNGHGQGPHMNGRGRGGRGGRGGNMGDRPQIGQQQGSSHSQQSLQQQSSQQTQPVVSPQPRPPQPTVPVNVPTRPQSPTLCKFGIKCTNASCRYSHPSAEGGLVLSSEYCEKGLECKDADCTKGHPSPAAINGAPVQAPAPQPRSSAPAGGIPCKFGAGCTRPGCTFVHPQKSGKPCRFGINCTRYVYRVCPIIGC